MIRKLGTMAASPERVLALFSNVESWPRWMPQIRATRILERRADGLVIDVERGARRRITTLDVNFRPDGYVERQLKGPARRWEADWRFGPALDGTGTVVSCRLDVDLGLAGFFVPRRTVQRAVDRTFERIVRGAEHHLRPAIAADHPAAPPVGVSSIEIFTLGDELEIWIDGRKYVAVARD